MRRAVRERGALRRDLVIVGVGLMVGGLFLTAGFGAFSGVDEFSGFFQFFGLVGLIVLIVGLAKGEGSGGGQQQQQQVVVVPAAMPGPPPSGFAPVAAAPVAPSLRCGVCKALNEADARFCQNCGNSLVPSRAPARPASRPPPRGGAPAKR